MPVDLTASVEPIATAIYKWWESKAEDWRRDHLGGSALGNPCERALWYGFRWCSPPKHDGRMLRLFDTGHREEPRFIMELRGIGCDVYDLDPQTGKQWVLRAPGIGGHVGGSMDAALSKLPGAEKTWHVGEFKTHNAKSFAKLVKEGVEKAKPMHAAQMNLYMGWTGMERALYVARNKDTDHLHTERVEFKKLDFDKTMAKAQRIVFAPGPLQKLSEDPTWYECRFCDHHATCHGKAVPPVSCRTCAHASPVNEGDTGTWRCAKWDNDMLTPDTQRAGCGEHLYIPPLLDRIAEPLDAGEGWVVYRRRDNGRHFVNAGESIFPPTEIAAKYANGAEVPGLYSSKELAANIAAVAEPGIDEIKQAFKGEARVSA